MTCWHFVVTVYLVNRVIGMDLDLNILLQILCYIFVIFIYNPIAWNYPGFWMISKLIWFSSSLEIPPINPRLHYPNWLIIFIGNTVWGWNSTHTASWMCRSYPPAACTDLHAEHWVGKIIVRQDTFMQKMKICCWVRPVRQLE